MAVTGTPKELPQTGSKDDSGNRKAVRRWIVDTDSETSQIALVMASTSLPSEGDAHPDDSTMTCKSLSYDQHDKRRKQWLVTASYEKPQPGDGEGEPPSPSSGDFEPAEYSITSETLTEYADKDLDGRPITNSINEFLAPGIERTITIAVYNIVRHVATCDDVQSKAYRNTVNNDHFVVSATGIHWGFNPGQALMSRYDVTRKYSATNGYYMQVTWEIKYREDGWRKKFLDQGFRETDPTEVAAGSQAIGKPIVSPNGIPISTPVLLDGNGARLADGDTPVFVPFGEGFKVYKVMPFAPLPLSVTALIP